ncbi:MAG: RHS repeat-associated core domain-containing protein, partial [Candidatus Auribacterota bacterium]
ALTDENGAVTDRFWYGPYGELVHRTGTTSTPFLYNGRDGVMTDENGLYYMRARYYNPEIKRFVNRDVIDGNIRDGQSLNRYAYVNGNPISYVDPFGLGPLDWFKDIDRYLYRKTIIEPDRAVWKKGIEFYLEPKGYKLTAALLENSLQDNPPDLTFSGSHEFVSLIKSSPEYRRLIQNIVGEANKSKQKSIYWHGEIRFEENKDLFAAVHRAKYGVTTLGVLKGDKWTLITEIGDLYNFEFHMRRLYGEHLKEWFANDLAYVDQCLGAIVPYDVTFVISDTRKSWK